MSRAAGADNPISTRNLPAWVKSMCSDSQLKLDERVRWRKVIACVDRLELDVEARAILWSLVDTVDGSGQKFRTLDDIAVDAGVSKSTVTRRLRRAIDQGWVEKTFKGSSRTGANQYRPTYPATQPRLARARLQDSAKPAKSSRAEVDAAPDDSAALANAPAVGPADLSMEDFRRAELERRRAWAVPSGTSLR